MKKHDKIVLLAKTKLKSIDLLIYRALINSYISHYEFGKRIWWYERTNQKSKKSIYVIYS